MKKQKELDDILKKLSEIEKGLSLDDRNKFVRKLDNYLSEVKFRLSNENRELAEEQFGGWV